MRVLLILALWMILPLAAAQDEPLLCKTSTETVVARYDWQSARLTLVSWNTGETIRDLETNFPVDSLYIVDWSPNCAYVLAQVTSNQITALYVWNVETGQRVGSLLGSAYALRTLWSDDSAYLLLQIEAGGYLWKIQTNTQTLLTPVVEQYYKRSFIRAEFDTTRNELLVVEAGSSTGVTAYNLSTGQRVGFYHIGERRGPVTYRRLDGNRYLLVNSDGRETISNQWYSDGLALWDRDTGENVQLDPNNDNFSLTDPFAFDSFGDIASRYFIIADYGRPGQLLIWDLQNISGSSPHVPNYQQQLTHTGEMRFIDSRTLEIADWMVQRFVHAPSRVRSVVLDLETLTVTHESPRIQLSYRCVQPPDDLVWACEQATANSYYDDTLPGMNISTYFPPGESIR